MNKKEPVRIIKHANESLFSKDEISKTAFWTIMIVGIFSTASLIVVHQLFNPKLEWSEVILSVFIPSITSFGIVVVSMNFWNQFITRKRIEFADEKNNRGVSMITMPPPKPQKK